MLNGEIRNGFVLSLINDGLFIPLCIPVGKITKKVSTFFKDVQWGPGEICAKERERYLVKFEDTESA